MILDLEDEYDDDDEDSDKSSKAEGVELDFAASTLYILIHARFLLTKPALSLYKERYQELDFGRCPRDGCGGCGVVPCGLSDSPNTQPVKLFCPRCRDLYNPRHSKFLNVDGCGFGTTFHNLLFSTYPELVPSPESETRLLGEEEVMRSYSLYVPRIFGFRISSLAVNGPKSGWLRRRVGDNGTVF